MKIKNFYKHYQYLKGEGFGLFQKVRLIMMSRYKPFDMRFFKKKISVPDVGAFRGVYQEIFLDQLYKFNSDSERPLIIDCGSNIGLSIIFFKRLYPECRILAFEADPDICSVLKKNINAFEFNNVEINEKAVWTNNESIEFVQEGGASGMIGHSGSNKTIRIPCTRLLDIIDRQKKIDLLKIDIEGAEGAVLKDCEQVLHKVDKIFIEYHSMEIEEQTLEQTLIILKKAGFRYHITEAFTSEQPFIARRTIMGMDLLLNIFAYKQQ